MANVTNEADNTQQLLVSRQELRELNVSAAEGRLAFPLAAKLDASLKKNNSFAKKVKSVTAANVSLLIDDVRTLSLEKYISEFLPALCEGILKLTREDDIFAAIKLVSALFQRFGQTVTGSLTSMLLDFVVSDLPAGVGSSKVLTALSVLLELQLTGIASTLQDCDATLLGRATVKMLSSSPQKHLVCIALAHVIVNPTKDAKSLVAVRDFVERADFFFRASLDAQLLELRASLLLALKTFSLAMYGFYQQRHQKELAAKRTAEKVAMKTGRSTDEADFILSSMSAAAFRDNLSAIYPMVGLEFIILDEPEEDSREPVISTLETDAKGWWVDVLERDFYKNIPSPALIIDRTPLHDKKHEELTEGQKVAMLLEGLENISSEKELETLTIALRTQIAYNKATKNKMLRFFDDVKKLDNLGYYAKFLCINADYFPDLISDLIENLDRGFRSQFYTGKLNFANISFFIELVKFKLIPSHVIFHKIRKMTLNIAGTSNADILLVFYERCGKFLLLEPEYLETTKEMLQLLKEKSRSDRLTVTEKLSLANMFLIVNSFDSPTQVEKQKVEELIMYDYVSQVLQTSITADHHMRAVELLAGVNYTTNSEARRALILTFLHPEVLAGDRLRSLCAYLHHVSMAKKNDFLASYVVDMMVEKVYRGLEADDYRQNVARIAQMKLFAALFNSHILNFRSVLDLLHSVLGFGYPGSFPIPHPIAQDASTNYFRINMVCALLRDVSLQKVEQAGLLKRKPTSLEGFLLFFQYYTFCKEQPLPRDIEYSIRDLRGYYDRYVGKLGSPLRIASDLSSAIACLKEFSLLSAGENSQERSSVIHAARDVEGESAESDADTDADQSQTLEAREEQVADFDDAKSTDGCENYGSDASDGSEILESLSCDSDRDLDNSLSEVEEDEEYFEPISDAASTREIDYLIKGMQSSLQTLSSRNTTLRMPAPRVLARSGDEGLPEAGKFRLLTKSHAMREMELPEDNQFSDRISIERAARQANREKIMNLIRKMQDP